MNLKTLAVLIALSLPLAGCGNKGSLVLPQKPVPVEESMPLDVPAEPAADATDTTTATDADGTVDDGTVDDGTGDAPPAEPPPTPAG